MRISDWSSDVCSSDLPRQCAASGPGGRRQHRRHYRAVRSARHPASRRGLRRALHRSQSLLAVTDRKSVVSGKSVSVRVDLGGRRIIKKKKKQTTKKTCTNRPVTRHNKKNRYNN